jgi:hypothetical protein
MMVSKQWSICLTLVCTLFIGQVGWAATYYVDRNLPGNDSNNGLSESAPFLRITKCVAVAINPGDTCLIKNGNYPEPVTMTRSGVDGRPITVKNYPGHTPILPMSGYKNSANRFELLGTASVPIKYITVQGLTIAGAYFGISMYNADHIVLRQNVLHHNGQQGILGNGSQIIIDGNKLYHNGMFAECAAGTHPCNQCHGMYLSGTYITITNNLIYDSLSFGIQVAGYPYDPSKHPSPAYATASNFFIANNTIAYQNYGAGIILWQSGATNNVIQNNILYENGQSSTPAAAQGVNFYNSGGGHTLRNNFFYANSPGATQGFSEEGSSGNFSGSCPMKCSAVSGNSVNLGDPNMITAPSTVPALPDFHLKSGSMAIDAGVNLTANGVMNDLDGKARPAGNGYDIGAYEFSSGGAAPTAPRGLRVQ